MSKPTEKELAPLKEEFDIFNSDGFHRKFDAALEAKLRELDPEWMEAMEAHYKESGMDRWYA